MNYIKQKAYILLMKPYGPLVYGLMIGPFVAYLFHEVFFPGLA